MYILTAYKNTPFRTEDICEYVIIISGNMIDFAGSVIITFFLKLLTL